MEACSPRSLPDGAGWQYEPKWDGFRCIARRRRRAGRSDQQVRQAARALLPGDRGNAFAGSTARSSRVDGELLIPAGDALSFEALQTAPSPAGKPGHASLRGDAGPIHAVRHARACERTDLGREPLFERRRALEQFTTAIGSSGHLAFVSSDDEPTARHWLARAQRRRARRRHRQTARPRATDPASGR